MTNWSAKHARDAYMVSQWSDGFFDICEKGRMLAYPMGKDNKVSIDLSELSEKLKEAGLTFPVLVRFTDIIQKRVQTLSNAFSSF